MPDRRGLLIAALGFAQLSPQTPALRALHAWLDTWGGVGALAGGLIRQGYDVAFEYRASQWQATIAKKRHGVRPGAAAGYASAGTPWAALQWAGWQALSRER
jgi:hypothetical protein